MTQGKPGSGSFSQNATEAADGVVKFQCVYCEQDCLSLADIAALNSLRTWLWDQGLVGVYPDGIGFGNVSVRLPGRGFVISGTQTGSRRILSVNDYALVEQVQIESNWLQCRGRRKASSESLSHAAVYARAPAVMAVAHGHHARLWRWFLEHGAARTGRAIPYGTPAMAQEISRCLDAEDTMLRGSLVMEGHQDGVLFFGAGTLRIQAIVETALQEMRTG